MNRIYAVTVCACLALATAMAGAAWGVKRYLCMEPLMKQALLTPLSA